MRPLSTQPLWLGQRPFRLSQWKRFAAGILAAGRPSSSLSHLQEEMISRKLPKIKDYGSATPSRLLRTTLIDAFGGKGESPSGILKMVRGYHLIYFPPAATISSLLPDGTDPLHSPGPPFTRRMWAGGDITFHDTIKLKGGYMWCRESITNIEIKGKEGEEKVFVTIQRNIDCKKHSASIVENRRLVFMQDRPHAAESPEVTTPRRDFLRAPHKADFSHSLTPSAALLFRFSALTFNAHRIHLDQAYCRDVEGHRNLLVHGPLSLVLMLHFLQARLANEGYTREGKADRVTHIDYRCLAPLYAEEELTVCIRRKDACVWETWIEGPDGGLAVRGTVRTSPPSGEDTKDKAATLIEGKAVDRSSNINNMSSTHNPQTAGPMSSTGDEPQEESTSTPPERDLGEIPTTAEEGALSADDDNSAKS